MEKVMTMRSVLAFIVANPGCCVNDVLTHFELGLENAKDDLDYLDREQTAAALMDRLEERNYVTHVATDREGWRYTAIDAEWTWR